MRIARHSTRNIQASFRPSTTIIRPVARQPRLRHQRASSGCARRGTSESRTWQCGASGTGQRRIIGLIRALNSMIFPKRNRDAAYIPLYRSRLYIRIAKINLFRVHTNAASSERDLPAWAFCPPLSGGWWVYAGMAGMSDMRSCTGAVPRGLYLARRPGQSCGHASPRRAGEVTTHAGMVPGMVPGMRHHAGRHAGRHALGAPQSQAGRQARCPPAW